MNDLRALKLDPHGAQLFPRGLSQSDLSQLRALADPALASKSGVRIYGGEIAGIVLARESDLRRIAESLLGPSVKPVRAILFDKTEESNWSVTWHQDRIIVVRERREVARYGPWSVKDGVVHVEPPFEIMQDMVTLRAHLDDCDTDNAPLLVALGSHRLGRVPTREIQDTVACLDTTSCLAQAGDIWAYATTIIHASGRTRRPQRRRVLQVDFSASELADGLEWLGIADDQ
jgi:hypothetical protein